MKKSSINVTFNMDNINTPKRSNSSISSFQYIHDLEKKVSELQSELSSKNSLIDYLFELNSEIHNKKLLEQKKLELPPIVIPDFKKLNILVESPTTTVSSTHSTPRSTPSTSPRYFSPKHSPRHIDWHNKMKKHYRSPRSNICGICLSSMDIINTTNSDESELEVKSSSEYCCNINKNVIILKCKHKFHHSCMAKWIKKKENTKITCPLCRSELSITDIYHKRKILNSDTSCYTYQTNTLDLKFCDNCQIIHLN